MLLRASSRSRPTSRTAAGGEGPDSAPHALPVPRGACPTVSATSTARELGHFGEFPGTTRHLMAALLLEQSALCFRSMRPALPRKFAFHLILAGFRFIQCGQRRHAVRAYAAALAVYSRKGWTHIEDHVHFTLGRNCATLGQVVP